MCNPTKITIFLLITLLLATSLGSAFGVVACERGCSSDVHHKNHDVGEHNDDVNDYSEIFYSRQVIDSDDSCRDYLIQVNDGIIEQKESVKCPTSTISAIPNTSTNLSTPYVCVSRIYLKSQFIVSQTIHAHRTVVLLS